MECGPYRAIKLLEHAMKVIECVFKRRIREKVKIDAIQFGYFFRGHSVRSKEVNNVMHGLECSTICSRDVDILGNRYGFLLVCYCNFVTKIFQIFDFKKCHDLEIRVRGHSRSLKVVPFDRLDMVCY